MIGPDFSEITALLVQLSDQLMEHPFECIPPIDDALRQALTEAGAAGDPVLVTYRYRSMRRMWSWNPDMQHLVRVMLPGDSH